ncbi:MAG TPA: DUF3990 domain-containing protein [Alphaproteobacteria bacterium]|nr:DUF3990 domain-containing protein [Alphaproteobacteria bacterium]
MPWNNGPVRLYHGCDALAARAMQTHGIDLTRCRPRTDFGRGFYTTTSEYQAKQWANQRARRNPQNAAKSVAIVIRFDVDRDGLAALQDLVFVMDGPDFYALASYCRTGSMPLHGRARPYDVVYGPVSLWQQRLVIKDCDQISFHTPEALDVLSSPQLHAQGNPYF